MVVVESLTKPLGSHEAHLDHFGDMVGVFPFPDLRIVVDMALNQLEIILAVVESLTKPVGGLSALLDHFGDMVGVFRFSQIYILWYIYMAPKPAWRHFGSC